MHIFTCTQTHAYTHITKTLGFAAWESAWKAHLKILLCVFG